MSDPQWGQPGQPPVPEPPSSFPPPPGAGQQWGAQTAGYPTAPAPSEVARKNAGGWALLAVAALVLLVLGLSIPEDDIVGWEIGAWAVFATVCCLSLFLPLFGAAFNLTPDRAWWVAAGK